MYSELYVRWGNSYPLYGAEKLFYESTERGWQMPSLFENDVIIHVIQERSMIELSTTSPQTYSSTGEREPVMKVWDNQDHSRKIIRNYLRFVAGTINRMKLYFCLFGLDTSGIGLKYKSSRPLRSLDLKRETEKRLHLRSLSLRRWSLVVYMGAFFALQFWLLRLHCTSTKVRASNEENPQRLDRIK